MVGRDLCLRPLVAKHIHSAVFQRDRQQWKSTSAIDQGKGLFSRVRPAYRCVRLILGRVYSTVAAVVFPQYVVSIRATCVERRPLTYREMRSAVHFHETLAYAPRIVGADINLQSNLYPGLPHWKLSVLLSETVQSGPGSIEHRQCFTCAIQSEVCSFAT